MQKELSIYVISHKKSFVPKSDVLLPLQVGCNVNHMHINGYLHDDEGDNISALNSQYCEMTGVYWIWKNDKDSKYIGLYHYRRYLKCSSYKFHLKYTNWKRFYSCSALTQKVYEDFLYDADFVSRMLKDYDLIYPQKSKLRERNINNFRELYSYGHRFTKELNYTLKLAERKYPQYKQAIIKCSRSRFGFHCNMFIMERTLFFEYADFMFSILDDVYQDIIHGKLISSQERLIGYLAEYLTGVFITYKEETCRSRSLDGVFFKYTDGENHRLYKTMNNIVCSARYILAPNQSKRRKLIYSVVDKVRHARQMR